MSMKMDLTNEEVELVCKHRQQERESARALYSVIEQCIVCTSDPNTFIKMMDTQGYKIVKKD